MEANTPRKHHLDGEARLAIKTDAEPGGVRVRPRGEIDLATVDSIRRHIDQCVAAGNERVVLDLRDVTFMDSTGLHPSSCRPRRPPARRNGNCD